MHFTRLLPLSLLAAILLLSCSDEFSLSSHPGGVQPINLSGQISQQNTTRANDYGFVTGDRMGIYIVDYNNGQPGTPSTDSRAANLLYTFDGDNYKWSATTPVYWRDEQTPVDVYGYYPGVNYIADPTAYNFEVQADQSKEAANGDLSGYEQSDLLWGKVTKAMPTTDVINVKMQHRLAGVRVHLTRGTGITSTEWQKLERIVSVDNTVRTATVNLATGTSSMTGSFDRPILMAPQSNDDYRAVVIPQTVASGKTLISITLDGIAYSHTLTQAMSYQAGKLHNFTITVNKNEQTGQYSISVTDDGITPWTNDQSSHNFSGTAYVIIHCPEMGTLKECITKAGYDYKTMQNLKVTGELTEEDFTLLREEMPELKHLNLKDVKLKHILIYNGWWDHYSHDYDRYDDDVMPGDALAHCNNIRSLVLPSGLKEIKDQAFWGMRGLMYSTLEVPEGCHKIGYNAFSYNEEYNGVELILPTSIDTIMPRAFYACGYKCNLPLTDNIRHIGDNAFDRTPNFHGVFHIPSHIDNLDGCFYGLGGEGTFTGEIEIPQGITYISGLNVGLDHRVAITFPKGVKEIGVGWPVKLSALNFNDDMERISGREAFAWHSLPFSITLPSSLMSISERAFLACGLEGELVIPENCLDIGGSAFAENRLTKITLPSKLEVIMGNAFGSNPITSITIPKYVDIIGERAFDGCDYLQTVISLNPEPPQLGDRAFGSVYFDKCVLEVPEQSVERYRHANGWKDFKNITAYHELAFNVPEIVCLDKGTTREGIIRAEGAWEVTECPSWVTVSPSSGNGKAELTVTVKSQSGGSTREGNIVFNLKGKNYTTYTTVRQVAASVKEDQTVTLQKASAGGTAIPIFLVGEGYGADDIASGQYLTDMQEQMEHLFSTEPFKTYRNYFTVSTAYACSPEEGLSGLTKFNGDDNVVWNYARTYGTAVNTQERTTILVLNKTSAYDDHTNLHDNGFTISWMGKTTDAYPYDQRGAVLHHLGGRGFGKLGPEYVNHFTFMKACGCPGCNMTNEYNWARSKGWWQNVSTTPKMTELPWQHLIFDERYAQIVDVYEGALNHARSTYRSENQSVMGAVHVYYYNTISRECIVRRIMQLAGKTFSLNDFFAKDKIELPQE